MLSSIQESFEKQASEQGKTIRSSERNYLLYLKWKLTVENDLFWRILHFSYALYRVYDYETIIKIFIKFGPKISKVNKSMGVYLLYRDYFDEVNGTLTEEGFEYLIKKIENAE